MKRTGGIVLPRLRRSIGPSRTRTGRTSASSPTRWCRTGRREPRLRRTSRPSSRWSSRTAKSGPWRSRPRKPTRNGRGPDRGLFYNFFLQEVVMNELAGAGNKVLEAAFRDFKRSVEITRDVRFQANLRLSGRQRGSAYIVSSLSLFVIALSLI